MNPGGLVLVCRLHSVPTTALQVWAWRVLPTLLAPLARGRIRPHTMGATRSTAAAVVAVGEVVAEATCETKLYSEEGEKERVAEKAAVFTRIHTAGQVAAPAAAGETPITRISTISLISDVKTTRTTALTALPAAVAIRAAVPMGGTIAGAGAEQVEWGRVEGIVSSQDSPTLWRYRCR